MDSDSILKLKIFFKKYHETFKPLLAWVEVLNQYHPLPLFNEIRSSFDHLSNCFFNSPSKEQIDKQIELADRHLNRLIFDCYKFILVAYHDIDKNFLDEYKEVDFKELDDGAFYFEYKKLRKAAFKANENAKLQETYNRERAFELYQDACNSFYELSQHLDNHEPQIHSFSARLRHQGKVKKFNRPIKWFLITLAGLAVAEVYIILKKLIIALYYLVFHFYS